MGGGERDGVDQAGMAAPSKAGGGVVVNNNAAGAAAAAGVGGGAVEKVKFTVSVRGHQWSSARHVHETLQEFASVIQRNARRLEFIEEGDSIQRLQLANGDGSEPEDLDVDATLEDVIICMGNKQLVAIVNSAKVPPASNGRPETEKLGPASPMALASLHKPKIKPDSTAPNSYNATPTSGAPDATVIDTESPCTVGPKFMLPPYKPSCRTAGTKPSSEPATRGLKIAIPPSDSAPILSCHEENRCAFHQDYAACERQAGSLAPMIPGSRSNSMNGKVVMCGGKGVQGGPIQFSPGNPTPSPAELAQFLVRSTSSQYPHRMQQQQQPGGVIGVMQPGLGGTQCNRSTPNGGFQSFASALLSRLPVMPTTNMHCPHGATTNIALLAQFLASQLRAFVPVEENAHPSADSTPLSPGREHKAAAALVKEVAPISSNAPPNSSNGQAAEKETHPELPGITSTENESPKAEAGVVKLSVSGSHDKDESSSSANVNTAAAPSSDGVDSEHPNGRSELIFLVNRRSKTGVGTHHLKMSDLSSYFHLSVVDAAKKLGVSQTTLKKACRKFGLKRWPGRKVRSLESTIHGLEHTIAVGQGAGLEELTEAYMRSEVSKLQQEMDQLVHGTPAQHSPAVRTADLYKRLYSRGWRSKYHSPGRHDLDLNNASHDNHSARKATETAKVVSSGCKVAGGGQTNQQINAASGKAQKPAALSKDESPKPKAGDFKDPTAVKENVNSEVLSWESNKEAHVEPSAATMQVAVDNGAVVNCSNTTTEKPCPERDQASIDDKDTTLPTERSPKRPKRECRSAAEGAGRQGLRSSTCAI